MAALVHSTLLRRILLSLLLVCCTLPCALASTVAAPAPEDFHEWTGEVIELNDANFESNLLGREVIVTFYAPWCGQCTIFKPVYNAWASEIHGSSTGLKHVAVARVDVTLNPELGSSQKIQAFPTIKFYRDGNFVAEHAGDRSKLALTKFVETHSKQPNLAADAPGQHTNQQAPAEKTQAKPGAAKRKVAESKGKDIRIPTDLTDVAQLKQLALDLMELPMQLFHARPYMVLTCAWGFGLFQGQHFGVRKGQTDVFEAMRARADNFVLLCACVAVTGLFLAILWLTRR